MRISHFVTAMFIMFSLLSTFKLTSAQTCPSIAESDAFADGVAYFDCGDYQNALSALNQALSNTSDPVTRARIQVYIGRAALQTNDFLTAQTQLERAFLAFNNAGLNQESGIAYYYAGLAKEARNLIGEAITYYHEAHRHALAAGDNVTQGLADRQLALYSQRQADLDQALELFHTSYSALLSTDNASEAVTSGQYYADLLFHLGNLNTAREIYNKNLAMSQEIGLDRGIGSALLRLSYWDIDNEDYPAAIEKLAEAQQRFELASDSIQQLRAEIQFQWVSALNGSGSAAFTALESLNSAVQDTHDCHLLMELFTYRGWVDMQIQNFSGALNDFGTALKQSCASDDLSLRSFTLRGAGEAYFGLRNTGGGDNMATILMRAGLLAPSIGTQSTGSDYLQFALTAARTSRDSVREREALISLGKNVFHESFFLFSTGYNIALPSSDVETARDYLYTAQRLAKAQNSTSTLLSIVQIFTKMDLVEHDYDGALTLLESALTSAVDAGMSAEQTSIIQQIGELYVQRGNSQAALDFFERARNTYKQTLDYASFDAHVLYYHGLIYIQNGDYDLAQPYLQQAATAFHNQNDAINESLALLAYGDVLKSLGRLEEAHSTYNEVITQAPLQIQLRARMSNGDVDLQSWDVEAAQSIHPDESKKKRIYDTVETEYQSVLEQFEAENDLLGQAETLNRLGLLGLRRSVPANYGTGGFFTAALTLSRVLQNRQLEMETLYNLGDYYYVVYDNNTALAYYNDSLKIATDLDPMRVISIQVNVARIYEDNGEQTRANQMYKQAVTAIESLYSRFSDESDRQRFGIQALQPYEHLIRYYGLNMVDGRAQDAETALNYAERSRARSFLFELSDIQLNGATTSQAALHAWIEARDNLLALTHQRQNAFSGGNYDQVAVLDNQISEAEQQFTERGTELPDGALKQMTGISPASLTEIQQSLPADTAMIVYYVSHETVTRTRREAGRIFTFVITPTEIIQEPTRFDSYEHDLLDRIDAFRSAVNSTDALASLYNLLIKPIEPSIAGYKNLVIVPHDVLNYLPFEALPDSSGVPIVERYAIQYAPSATIYKLLHETQQPTSRTSQALVMSYGEDLVYAEDEAYAVAKLNQTQPYTFEDATETRMRELAGSADLIHLAAHGLFDPLNPLASYIALGADDQNDGKLTVSEIYTLPLREHSPLIVLSACETAVSSINPGDELQGLSRAFLLSGARGVVASLWQVDDAKTQELMETFYRARINGMDTSNALTYAKRSIRAKYHDPIYWASFVLIGG